MFTRENDHVVEAAEETQAWWLLGAYHWRLDLMLEAVSEYQLLSAVLLVSSPRKREFHTEVDATPGSLTTPQIQLI